MIRHWKSKAMMFPSLGWVAIKPIEPIKPMPPSSNAPSAREGCAKKLFLLFLFFFLQQPEEDINDGTMSPLQGKAAQHFYPIHGPNICIDTANHWRLDQCNCCFFAIDLRGKELAWSGGINDLIGLEPAYRERSLWTCSPWMEGNPPKPYNRNLFLSNLISDAIRKELDKKRRKKDEFLY